MKGNPYSKLLEITKGKKGDTINVLVGEVLSTYPLAIVSGDLQIGQENVLFADYLLDGYSRSYSTDRYLPNGSDTGTLVYTDGICIGDRLAMLQTADKQLYIITARVRRF